VSDTADLIRQLFTGAIKPPVIMDADEAPTKENDDAKKNRPRH